MSSSPLLRCLKKSYFPIPFRETFLKSLLHEYLEEEEPLGKPKTYSHFLQYLQSKPAYKKWLSPNEKRCFEYFLQNQVTRKNRRFSSSIITPVSQVPPQISQISRPVATTTPLMWKDFDDAYHLLSNTIVSMCRTMKWQNVKIPNPRQLHQQNTKKNTIITYKIYSLESIPPGQLLILFDQQYQKYNDSDIQECWLNLYHQCIHLYDLCVQHQWINPSFKTSTQTEPIRLNGCLSLWSSSPSQDKGVQTRRSPPVTTQVTLRWIEGWSPYRVDAMNSPCGEMIKVGIILYALCGSSFMKDSMDSMDSIWKKTTPFVFDGGRVIERQQSSQQRKQIQIRIQPKESRHDEVSSSIFLPLDTYQSILFKNQLMFQKYNTLMKNANFWFREISSPVIGYLGDLHLRIVYNDMTKKYSWGDSVVFRCLSDYVNQKIFQKEVKKPHLVWMIDLQVFDSQGRDLQMGHRNGILFSNNTFFYIEPNGTTGTQGGNIFLQGVPFRIMWDQIRSDLESVRFPWLRQRLQVDNHNKTLVPHQVTEDGFLYQAPQFVLHSTNQEMNLLHVQSIIELSNKKQEEGGYCVSITLFLLDLFSQNCDLDPHLMKPWTIQRFQDMIKTYMLISQFTGSLSTDIRGLNVAVMKTMKSLERLREIQEQRPSSLISSESPQSSTKGKQRRKAVIF